MCNFTFIHWLSLSVVVIWTTLKSLVWEVIGTESGLAHVGECVDTELHPQQSLSHAEAPGGVCAHLS